MIRLTLFSLTLLVAAEGCKVRNDSSEKAVTLMDAEGEVLMYHPEQTSIIVITQCKDFTVVSQQKDCVPKEGTQPVRVQAQNFADHLKVILFVMSGNYDKETKAKIDAAKSGKPYDQKKLEAERAVVAKDLENIKAFTQSAGGETDASRQRKAAIEAKLAEVDKRLTTNQPIVAAVAAINKEIIDFINNIILKPEMYQYKSTAGGSGQIMFNFLKSYLRTPNLRYSLVAIKPATFTMGSPPAEIGRGTDEDQKSASIAKEVGMGATEVTQLQWYMYMGNNPSYFNKKENCPKDHALIYGTPVCPGLPVESFTWAELQQFLKIRSDKLPGWTFRLPTEEEWEYAARAETQTPFNLGEAITGLRVNFAEKDFTRGQTSDVGSLGNANKWGFSDMHGNVAELVTSATSGNGEYVIRGGSWDDSAENCRSANRATVGPDVMSSRIGFRFVAEQP